MEDATVIKKKKKKVKKRKSDDADKPQVQEGSKAEVPKKAKHDRAENLSAAEQEHSGPQLPTVSIAVAASVIDNTQSAEQATSVAGQIARTAAIFNVDEVVVIDDSPGPEAVGKGAALLARILQFMETPQYLRKALLPMHRDLRLAGQLPPLDAPHHMRAAEWHRFREGVVLRSAPGAGSVLDVGLELNTHVEHALRPGARVTLELGQERRLTKLEKGPLGQRRQEALTGRVALPSEPRAKTGTYWGYAVRIASGLTEALEGGCPYEGGYDFTIGTSERGSVQGACELDLPPFQHALIAFGGPTGLEDCLSRDPAASTDDVRMLFDTWLNTCPDQGSRTIRTQEALLISLAYLQPALRKACTT